MAVTRRRFLRLAASGAVVLGGLPVWRTARAAEPAAPLLVVVFLRGGADALSLVPPLGEPLYTDLRGPLAVDGALPFAAGFGLHPSLAPLSALVDAGRLAVVHCAGSHDSSRSHFEAQDRMELGSGERPRWSEGGWLTRALGEVEADAPFRQLAFGFESPASLHGADAFAIGRPQVFRLGGASPEARAALEHRYAEAADGPLGHAGVRALNAARAVRRAVLEGGLRPGAALQEMRADPAARAETRPGSGLFLRQIEGLAKLDAAGFAIEAAALDIDGWDTHAGQQGAFARAAGSLASGLAELTRSFEARRTLRIVVMTEFGRTVRPNGSRGTDHGHGAVMLVSAPDVRGGLHGDWRGLSEPALFEGRDLPVTTDYRLVLREVLRAHLGSAPPRNTFPGLQGTAPALFT